MRGNQAITVLLWILTFLYACLIFYLSSLPGGQAPPIPLAKEAYRWLLDSTVSAIAHAIQFGILAMLLAGAVNRTWSMGRKKVMMIAIITALTYALFDEFHQTFVPNRDFQFEDLFADWGGAVLFASIWCKFRQDLPPIQNEIHTRNGCPIKEQANSQRAPF